MPPMVQRLAVDGSTGKNSPSLRSRAFRRSSTTPGATDTVPRRRRRRRATALKCRLQVEDEAVADRLAVLRGAAAARDHRHAMLARRSASAAATSASDVGKTTPAA